jgi:hypothetical protein
MVILFFLAPKVFMGKKQGANFELLIDVGIVVDMGVQLLEKNLHKRRKFMPKVSSMSVFIIPEEFLGLYCGLTVREKSFLYCT